ncbi:MAG TPA: tripartite tricarboxylate transporter substrate binding protein [Burkholderiales bacterium]
MRISGKVAGILASFLFAALAGAQTYPAKPVKVIVPWPPGQATDIAARLMAQKLQEALGQPFVVENKPGAGGAIGTDAAAKSAADGYTLLAASSGPVSIMPSLQKIPYDPVKDLVLLGVVAQNGYVLVTSPSFPASNTREFIAEVKAHPDKYTFASSGTGATAHLFGELFNYTAGLKARHVPYKGTAPAITDVINGQVTYMMETVAATQTQVKAGRLKAFAISTLHRSAALPDVPTVAESTDMKDFDAAAWIGYATATGTPQPVVQRLSGEMQKIMASKEMRDRLLNLGLDPANIAPGELPAFLQREQERYAQIVKAANVRIE